MVARKGIPVVERDKSTRERESLLLKGTNQRAKGNLALRKGQIRVRKGIPAIERDKTTRERESQQLKGTNPRAKGKPRR